MQTDPFASMMGGGAGGGAPASISLPSAGGGAQGGGGGTPGQPDNRDAEQALNDLIDAAHRFVAAEEDDTDKNVVAKILALATGITAGRQKQDEAAMGTTPAHKAVSRAVGKAGGGAGGGY